MIHPDYCPLPKHYVIQCARDLIFRAGNIERAIQMMNERPPEMVHPFVHPGTRNLIEAQVRAWSAGERLAIYTIGRWPVVFR
jgi:hypothetical protein